MLCIREAAPQNIPQETDLARRWHRLPLQTILPLSGGAHCRLVYAGRPGGPQGPDIRDAVIAFGDEVLCGNVEFHVRCSDWYSHRHHIDPRYNNVILHVVLVYDSPALVSRQDGQPVPILSLNDIATHKTPFPPAGYPCERKMSEISPEHRDMLLRQAGLERFEQKTEHFLKLLRDAQPCEPFSAYDTCLIPSLAEALGYGRDRDFFRAAGLRLVGHDADLPEPEGRAPYPSPLDTGRLQALRKLIEQWRASGAWNIMRKLLTTPYDMANTLRALFPGISSSRADIVICNVVLPFALAVAIREDDTALYARVRRVYLDYPGLASNQVTRAMSKQLRLSREPGGACQQQGLHHIYTQTCREKRCGTCLITQWRLEL